LATTMIVTVTYAQFPNKAKMKLPLLLALLFGTVSAFHLRTEMSNVESPLGDDTLPQVGEMPEHEAKEAPLEELMLLEKEEERGSGGEDAPREEGTVESISALEEVGKDFQCPKEEDTVKVEGISGCKTCRFLLVTTALNFNSAQVSGQWLRRRGLCIRCHWIDGSPWNFAPWVLGQPWTGCGGCVSMCIPGEKCNFQSMEVPFGG
ncbi:Bone marrow proteoglycan, partial [Camelus dromedarius]